MNLNLCRKYYYNVHINKCGIRKRRKSSQRVEFNNIKGVHLVYGVYDTIAKVEAESMEKLKELVTLKIRRLSEVRSTLTMTVVDGF